MIPRLLADKLVKKMDDHKALIILGPRQSGKTTLVKALVEQVGSSVLWWTGDDFQVRSMLSVLSLANLQGLIGDAPLLVIDEAQRIENIGLCIKIIVDNIPGVKVIATGSSAFELANRINEPMTGRKWEYTLLPLSYKEMVNYHGELKENSSLQHRMIYGYYPEVVNNPGQETDILKQLADSYLYKDILTWEKIHKPDRMEKLVRALAFQVGNQVSYHELGQVTGLDNETVEKYIDLLEKAFIVYRLGTLSRNLRNELKATRKLYFYDNGIRNALINSFNPMEMRDDAGVLWENFLMTERLKYIYTHDFWCNRYFWRTHAQQEIDYIEEYEGRLHAFEFKWNPKRKGKIPAAFLNAYPDNEASIITRENFRSFLGV
ncbi:MAG: ATP-binding protein [Bacteroidales bacterium]|nr:ATP-binding protein [Bacteroidales bacterium]